MRRGSIALVAIITMFVLILAGCSGNDGARGAAGAAGTPGDTGASGTPGDPGAPGPVMPVIQSLFVEGSPSAPDGTMTATVIVQSAEGLALTYEWSVLGAGWSVASGGDTDTVTIAAPANYSASGTASVMVTDANGKSAVGTIALATQGNTAPVIQSISIYPPLVLTSANLVASAFDQNGDPLTYSWTIGGITDIATGSNTTWVSPGIPGYYNISLSVSDNTTSVSGNSFTYMSIGSQSPWPRFRRGIQGTGQSPVIGSATGEDSKWEFLTFDVGDGHGGPINSSPAIGPDGTVYVGSDDGYLYAINPDGTEKWSFETGDSVTSSPAIGADGTVYVGSNDGFLYAINPDGTKKWSVETGDYVTSSPAIGADGTIYVGSNDGFLYAINPDGTKKWSYEETGGPVTSSPAIGAGGTVYVGSYDGYLYAINSDGSYKWSFGYEDPIYSSPAIGADGTIYVGDNYGYLYAIE